MPPVMPSTIFLFVKLVMSVFCLSVYAG